MKGKSDDRAKKWLSLKNGNLIVNLEVDKDVDVHDKAKMGKHNVITLRLLKFVT